MAFVLLGLAPTLAFLAQPAWAASYTWDANGDGSLVDGGGTWSAASVNWWNGSTDVGWSNVLPYPSAVIGSANGTAGTISVSDSIDNVSNLTFNAPGSGNYTITGNTLGVYGNVTDNAPGVTTISPASLNLYGGQSWTAASGGTLAINPSSTASFTAQTPAGMTVNFNGSGTFTTTLPTQYGILGPWATINSGTNAQFATVNGSGAIVPYAGATVVATAAGVTGTAGTANYSVAAGGNSVGNDYCNTLYYNGSTGTIGGGANFGFNSLLAVGTGTLFITNGSIVSGIFPSDSTTTTFAQEIYGGTQPIVLIGNVYSQFSAGKYSAALTYDGNSVLTLAYAASSGSQYDLLTTISSGTLQLGNGTGTTGVLQMQHTTGIIDNGNFTVNDAVNMNSTTNWNSQPITGSGSFTKAGSGTVTLNVANTYTGGTFVNNGTLQFGNSQALSAANGPLTVNGGTLNIATFSPTFGAVSLLGGSIVASSTSAAVLTGTSFNLQNGSVSAALGGAGVTLNVTNNGVVTLSSSASSYTGTTTIGAGTLNVSSLATGASSLGSDASAVNLGDNSGDTGVLNFTGNSNTFVRGFTVASGGGQINTATPGQTLTIGTGDISGSGSLVIGGAGNTTISSAIQSGITSVTAAGSGNVVLSGNNTYTGSTSVASGALYLNGGSNATSSISVAGGTLYINSSQAIPSISVAGGATLGGSGSVTSGTTTVQNGGSISGGYSGSGTLSLAALTFSSSGNIDVNASSLLNYVVNPTLSVTGSNAFVASGGANSISIVLSGAAPVGIGVARLIGYSGSIAGGLSDFTLNTSGVTVGPRTLLSLTATDAGYIDLSYSVDHPVWSGTGAGGIWDTKTTPNWVLASSPSTATTFFANDAPVFDDTATGTTTVNISGTGDVLPLAITFNNNVKNYILQGTYGIAGSGNLTMNGTGALTILNANSYSGGTVLNAGLLQVGNNSALGTGPLTLSGGALTSSGTAAVSLPNALQMGGSITLGDPVNNGGLTFSGSANSLTSDVQLTVNSPVTITGGISGGNNVFFNGNGPLILAGNNTYSGSTTITSGTLQIGNGTSGENLASPSINNNGTLVFNHADTLTMPGAIGGTGDLVMAGNGRLILAGNNSYSGSTTISSGTLQIGSGGSGENLASPTINNNGTLVFNHADTLTLPGAIGGSGGLVMAGSGTLVLTNANNSYSGNTTLNAGTVAFSNSSALGTGTVYLNGGGVFWAAPTNYATMPNNLVANPGTVSAIGGTAFFGNYNGSLVGSGTLQMPSTYVSKLVFNGDWSGFTGSIVVPAGDDLAFCLDGIPSNPSVSTTSGNALANFTINGILFALDNVQQGTCYMGALSGGGVIYGKVGRSDGVTLQIGSLNQNTTFSGQIIDNDGVVVLGATPVSLDIVGSGSLTLGGANTFTGNVTVDGGTLVGATPSSGGAGMGSAFGALSNARTITVNAGGTLQFSVSNVFGPIGGTTAPTLAINGGVVTNADPTNSNTVNNVLNGVMLTGGTLTSTAGNGPAARKYGAWDINGTVTSSGVSSITTSSPNGQVMLNSTTAGPNTTTFNVLDTTLTVSAPLVQDNFDGVVSGLNLTGAGTLLLTASNTYGGGTTISSGTLQIGNSAALPYGHGAGDLAVNAPGLLDLAGFAVHANGLNGNGTIDSSSTAGSTLEVGNNDATSVFYGVIQNTNGAVALTKVGIGALTLVGSNIYSGATTVSAGSLAAGMAYSLSPSSGVTVAGGVLDVTAGPQTVKSLAITSGFLNLSVGNVLSITNSASFAGTLAISGSIGSLPELLMTYGVGQGSGSFSGVYDNGLSLAGSDLSYSGGSVEVVSLAPGTAFSGSGTWTGISGFWSGFGNWTDSHGIFGVPGDGTRAAGTDTAAFSGSSAITAITLDINANLAALSFSRSNYTLNGGTLTMTSSSGTSSVTVTGGTQMIASALVLANTSTAITLNGNSRLTIGGNIYDGTGGDNAALALGGDGTGQLVLSGANTYAGGTYVNAGTLIVNSATALAEGTSLTVGQGASSIFAPAAGPPLSAAPAGVTAVPEPGTLMLLLAALGSAVICCRFSFPPKAFRIVADHECPAAHEWQEV